MLKIINLFVIESIFNNEAQHKLSAMSKMLYINILMHYFKDKKANVANVCAFELNEKDFSDYDKFKKYVLELQKAQLVTIDGETIAFNCAWSKYIDRTQLEKITPGEYIGLLNFHDITEYTERLLEDRNLYELSAMRYKLNRESTKAAIELFIKEQETVEKKYTNVSECIKHCIYWVGKNTDKVQNTTVKSKGKLFEG